jgi:hypothetical protein
MSTETNTVDRGGEERPPVSVLVTVKYPRGHMSRASYTADSSLFCPYCGAHRVWVEDGNGDYYDGPEHVCAGCGASFSLKGGAPVGESSPDTVVEQTLAALRGAATHPEPPE